MKLFDQTLSTVTPVRDSTNDDKALNNRYRRGQPLPLILSDSCHEEDMPVLTLNDSDCTSNEPKVKRKGQSSLSNRRICSSLETSIRTIAKRWESLWSIVEAKQNCSRWREQRECFLSSPTRLHAYSKRSESIHPPSTCSNSSSSSWYAASPNNNPTSAKNTSKHQWNSVMPEMLSLA